MARARKQIKMASFQEIDADELKNSVREMLVSMEALERKLFIKTLEYEMSRTRLSIRPCLIPLGIAAEYAEDLTPTEVGHLIRFFRINVPKAMSAVVRVLAGALSSRIDEQVQKQTADRNATLLYCVIDIIRRGIGSSSDAKRRTAKKRYGKRAVFRVPLQPLICALGLPSDAR
jgi:hypothetical protein